jgi:hypothetical protein
VPGRRRPARTVPGGFQQDPSDDVVSRREVTSRSSNSSREGQPWACSCLFGFRGRPGLAAPLRANPPGQWGPEGGWV